MIKICVLLGSDVSGLKPEALGSYNFKLLVLEYLEYLTCLAAQSSRGYEASDFGAHSSPAPCFQVRWLRFTAQSGGLLPVTWLAYDGLEPWAGATSAWMKPATWILSRNRLVDTCPWSFRWVQLRYTRRETLLSQIPGSTLQNRRRCITLTCWMNPKVPFKFWIPFHHNLTSRLYRLWILGMFRKISEAYVAFKFFR